METFFQEIFQSHAKNLFLINPLQKHARGTQFVTVAVHMTEKYEVGTSNCCGLGPLLAVISEQIAVSSTI